MNFLSGVFSKGPDLKADVLDAGTELKGSKLAWKIHEGKRKDNGTPVTVFSWEITATSSHDEIEAAKNAYRRLKTARHPDVLQFIDGAEPPEGAKPGAKVFIVTDHVTPLEQYMQKEKVTSNVEAASWGLSCIARAINFLNKDCKLIHGNVNLTSVMVADNGDWKLAGFEMVCEPMNNNSVFRRCENMRQRRVMPPEVSKGMWNHLDRVTHAIDTWSYGCLIHEVYNGQLSQPQDLKNTTKMPRELIPIYQRTLKANPEQRPEVPEILESPFFETQLVWINKELSELALKEPGQKEAFFVKLNESLDAIPDTHLRYKILPELLKAVEFGGAGTAAIGPTLKIGQRMSAEDFSKEVVPGVVRCFGSQDRGTRIGLLQNLHTFAEHLTPALVEKDIFPKVASGFTDQVPALRELSVKSLVFLVPKLSEKVINSQVLRAVAQLQQDAEGSIRCNTTICLGKISTNLSPATREKILLPSFGRAVNDPFPPARIAALMALTVTMEYYQAADVAKKVLPAVGMLTIDPEKEVREQALNCLKSAVGRLEEASARMADELSLAGGTGVVQAPTVNDSGVMSWAASAAATSLTKSLWGGSESGAGSSGPNSAKAAGNSKPAAGSAQGNSSQSAGGKKAQEEQVDSFAEWDGPAEPKKKNAAGWDDDDWGDDPFGGDSKPASQSASGFDDFDDFGTTKPSAPKSGSSARASGSRSTPKKQNDDGWGSLLDDPPPKASKPKNDGWDDPPAKAPKSKQTDDWDADSWLSDAVAAPAPSSAKKGKPMKLGAAKVAQPAKDLIDNWEEW